MQVTLLQSGRKKKPMIKETYIMNKKFTRKKQLIAVNVKGVVDKKKKKNIQLYGEYVRDLKLIGTYHTIQVKLYLDISEGRHSV